MNQNFEKIYLNEKAYSFVKKQFGLSGSLSNLLSEIFLNSKVQVWGFFSIGLTETDLIEFEYGGKFKVRPRQEVGDIVNKYLEKDNNNVWMLVDNVGNFDYPPEKNAIEDITTVFFYNEMVLHLLTKKPISSESIIKTFTFGGAYPYIGFITKITSFIEEEIKKNNVKKESIEFLVKNISLIVIGAYDEEGYLIVEIEK